MPVDILTIPCLDDNYAYAVRDPDTGEVAVVDVPETAPILRTLSFKGWGLNQVLVTHHHGDHIQGLPLLREAIEAPVIGSRTDSKRLPELALPVSEGDVFTLGRQPIHVYRADGHTIGHIAYHFPDSDALFTGDSLMVMGCGRLFEGDAETMWATLSKFMELPSETRIYSGHEYTAANAKFALSVEPKNQALIKRVQEISELRAKGEPTMGSTLELEIATNPFLRAGMPEMKAAVGMEGAPDAKVFAKVRQLKDQF